MSEIPLEFLRWRSTIERSKVSLLAALSASSSLVTVVTLGPLISITARKVWRIGSSSSTARILAGSSVAFLCESSPRCSSNQASFSLGPEHPIP